MFEDRIEENILDELLERITTVNTNEGSLVHIAESSNAVTYHEVYVALRYLYEQLSISTMDLEHLIEKGKEKGVYYNYATYAEYKSIFLCEMEIGDTFTMEDMTFILTQEIGKEIIEGTEYYTYVAECQTAGTEGNNYLGMFETFLGVNDNYNDDGRNYKLLIAAEDDEDKEAYRTRIMEKTKAQEFAGNILSYITEIKNIQGVEGVKPIPRTSIEDIWTYKIYILATGGKKPSDTLVQKIQDYIDPSTDASDLTGIYGLPELENTAGKGYGLAPGDHVVVIRGVEEQKINISITAELSGRAFKDIEEKLDKIIDTYLNEIIVAATNGWQESTSLTVKRSEIMSRLVTAKIEGVNDISEVLVNGEKTVKVPYTHIPVRGNVTCTNESGETQ